MCLAGELWNETQKSCEPCDVGTYNSAPGYNLFCAPCSTTCGRNAHKWYKCNGTHDMTCECDEGYVFSPSNPKHCVPMKKLISKVYGNITESILGSPTSLPWEQDAAFSNSTTNTSATTDQMSWLPDWDYISPLAWGIIGFLFLSLFILAMFYVKKSCCSVKHQRPNAVMGRDQEEGSIGAQPEFQGEKHQLIWNHVARNGPSQFSNGGSEREDIPESGPDADCPDSVRFAANDRVGESLLRNGALPSSSLCAVQGHFCSSLNLKEDEEILTPIKEVA